MVRIRGKYAEIVTASYLFVSTVQIWRRWCNTEIRIGWIATRLG
jgi:hypothetical protein